MRPLVSLIAAWLALGVCAAAVAADELVLPAPGAAGWRPLAFPRVARHTRYEREGDGAQASVRATSECAASALLHPLDGVDLARTPVLRWRWRVEEARIDGDPRTKAGDDFAARVYVLFRFDAAQASLAQRARHTLGATLFGEDLPGIALNYVVAPRMPAGTHWDNPYTSASKMISRGALAPGVWREESADVARDYRALVGAEPSAVMGLALMTDTDDGCGAARASFAGFRFVGREE